MEPAVICEFDTSVSFGIPSDKKQKILRAVNTYNINRETVPLDEEWPEGRHGPMPQVHHNLAMTYTAKLTVQVMSDGRLILKKAGTNG